MEAAAAFENQAKAETLPSSAKKKRHTREGVPLFVCLNGQSLEVVPEGLVVDFVVVLHFGAFDECTQQAR